LRFLMSIPRFVMKMISWKYRFDGRRPIKNATLVGSRLS
jgi:hypothetical protein